MVKPTLFKMSVEGFLIYLVNGSDDIQEKKNTQMN
jgi:hypothetical protein